ncbi:hypothetical protein [Bacteroides faecis]|uniref:hypothetical protein n=1 Tax=Bacteroides faecis TaxID=674529 RepID=UPI0035B23DF5
MNTYNFELIKNPWNDTDHIFLVQADAQVTSEDDVRGITSAEFLKDMETALAVQPYTGKQDVFGKIVEIL